MALETALAFLSDVGAARQREWPLTSRVAAREEEADQAADASAGSPASTPTESDPAFVRRPFQPRGGVDADQRPAPRDAGGAADAGLGERRGDVGRGAVGAERDLQHGRPGPPEPVEIDLHPSHAPDGGGGERGGGRPLRHRQRGRGRGGRRADPVYRAGGRAGAGGPGAGGDPGGGGGGG